MHTYVDAFITYIQILQTDGQADTDTGTDTDTYADADADKQAWDDVITTLQDLTIHTHNAVQYIQVESISMFDG